MKKRISILLTVVMVASMVFAGCGNGKVNIKENANNNNSEGNTGEFVVEGLGEDPYADYTVSGDLKVAINLSRPTDYEAVLDKFQELYPDINLTVDYFSGSDLADEYLASNAATGTLPDVVFDEPGKLPIYIRQGWLYPLDEFVKDDPYFEDVDKGIISNYTFNGKLYALPNSLTFQTMVLNTGILDELNLDHPELDWTIEDYTELLKAATNSTYSGCETLWFWTDYGSAIFSGAGDKWGYLRDQKQFDMKISLLQSAKLMENLNAIPGLVAESLRTTKDTSGETDYAKKFGGNASGVAFNTGKVLMESSGTWKYAGLESTLSYDWEMWTTPQDEAGRICMHVDHSFMCSTTQNPEAAFQLLRFLTYSPEGNFVRLAMYAEENEDTYALNDRLYFPATQNEEVLSRFYELEAVTEVDKYFMENVNKAFRGDPFKYVPEYNELQSNYFEGLIEDLAEGGGDASSQIASVQVTVNNAIAEAWKSFEADLAKIQQEFEAAH